MSDPLDMLSRATMERKAEAGAKLTPVRGEVVAPPPPPSGVDAAVLRDILSQVDGTERAIGGLFAILRSQVRKALPLTPDPGMELNEGDALAAAKQVFGDDLIPVEEDAFAAEFAAKSAAAQTATFKPEPTEATGWACPTHGRSTIAALVSGKGREYWACGSCKQFEK